MSDAVAAAARLREAEERMAWIEGHPAFSAWLKDALASARGRDPVAVMNDLEILWHLLRGWATASIEAQREVSERALR
jgi:hypothetical protein